MTNVITPQDVFGDQSLSDILSWADHVRYHDVYYHDEKNLCITYLDPTTYSAWLLYQIHESYDYRFHTEYLTHLKNIGYVCVYFQSEFSDQSESLRSPVTPGHVNDMFSDIPFTHRCVL